MVALPFWLTTANAELRANGWGTNMRTQAGLPAAGMLSQLVNRTAIQLIENPRVTNFVPVQFWFDGTNTIIKHGGPYGSTAEYAVIRGQPYVSVSLSGPVVVDDYPGGWMKLDHRIILRQTYSAKWSAQFIFSSSPDGSTSRIVFNFGT